MTRALTGVSDVSEFMCNICTSTVRGVGGHHIEFRSRGGIDGPVLPICQTCLAPDSLILTERGPLPVSEIQAGDRLLHVDSKYAVQDRPYLPVVREVIRRPPTRPCLRVKARGLIPLTVTDDHRFRVLRERRRVEWVEAGDLERGDLVQVTVDRRIVDDIEMDDDAILVLGWFISEGSLIWDKVRDVVQGIEFSLGSHEQVAADSIIAAVSRRFGIKARCYPVGSTLRVRAFGQPVTLFINRHVAYRRIEGEADSRVAKRRGGVHHSANKRFASAIMLLPPAKQWRLVMQAVAGDGCETKNRQHPMTVYVTTSRVLAGQIQMMCWRNGVVASADQRPPGRASHSGTAAPVIPRRPSYRIVWWPESDPEHRSGRRRGTGRHIKLTKDHRIQTRIHSIEPAASPNYVYDLVLSNKSQTIVTMSGAVHNCHSNIHGTGNKPWRLEVNAKGLYLYEASDVRQPGNLIWRLERWPLKADPGDIVQALGQVGNVARQIDEFASALTPMQALEVHNALKSVGAHAWRGTARLIFEMHRYRMPHLDPKQRIEGLARFFDIRRTTVYNFLQIVEAFQEAPEILDDSPIGKDLLRIAAGTKHPVQWAKHAAARKVEHPTYSASDLRQESIDDREQPVERPKPDKPVVYAKCGSCGHTGWMQKLPVGSDGKPIDIGEGTD